MSPAVTAHSFFPVTTVRPLGEMAQDPSAFPRALEEQPPAPPIPPPGREMPTDLKGVFSADVVRRLHCRHAEAQERDAAQNVLLLLICKVNRGPGEMHGPMEEGVSPITTDTNKYCSSTACQALRRLHTSTQGARTTRGTRPGHREPGSPADIVLDAGVREANEAEVVPTLQELTLG